jgi:hypothetical protein
MKVLMGEFEESMLKYKHLPSVNLLLVLVTNLRFVMLAGASCSMFRTN